MLLDVCVSVDGSSSPSHVCACVWFLPNGFVLNWFSVFPLIPHTISILLQFFYPSERERENRHKRECSGIRNNIQIEKMNDEMKWLEMYAYDKRTK